MSVRDPNLELLQETNQLIGVAEFKGWTLDEFLQSLSWLFITLSFLNAKIRKLDQLLFLSSRAKDLSELLIVWKTFVSSSLSNEDSRLDTICSVNWIYFFPFTLLTQGASIFFGIALELVYWRINYWVSVSVVWG